MLDKWVFIIGYRFGYIKGKFGYQVAGAKNLLRNSLRFDMKLYHFQHYEGDELLNS